MRGSGRDLSSGCLGDLRRAGQGGTLTGSPRGGCSTWRGDRIEGPSIPSGRPSLRAVGFSRTLSVRPFGTSGSPAPPLWATLPPPRLGFRCLLQRVCPSTCRGIPPLRALVPLVPIQRSVCLSRHFSGCPNGGRTVPVTSPLLFSAWVRGPLVPKKALGMLRVSLRVGWRPLLASGATNNPCGFGVPLESASLVHTGRVLGCLEGLSPPCTCA